MALSANAHQLVPGRSARAADATVIVRLRLDLACRVASAAVAGVPCPLAEGPPGRWHGEVRLAEVPRDVDVAVLVLDAREPLLQLVVREGRRSAEIWDHVEASAMLASWRVALDGRAGGGSG